MSRSSSDVFEDIVVIAGYANELAHDGLFHRAASCLQKIKPLIKEAGKRLRYEAKCKGVQ